MNITYEYFWGRSASFEQKKELADFYSSHYGMWSENDPEKRGGRNISLSPGMISKWLSNDYSELWTARDGKILIGYAIALRGFLNSQKKDQIIWVTQFVVHKEHRHEGIGKKLLFSLWNISSAYAWGLVTASPYAIRALEKATRRKCDPKNIKQNIEKILHFGSQNIIYINKSIEKEVGNNSSKVNTNFYITHSKISEMLERTTSEECLWQLGNIEEGWEWIAFTFKDQLPFEFTKKEIEDMMNASDSVARQAYSRMPMDLHKWACHADKEVEYIINTCKLSPENKILDIGCGLGRHTIEFKREKQYNNIIGIDYVDSLIESAKKKAKEKDVEYDFQCIDITASLSKSKLRHNDFDAILCLYDVVGSYVDNLKNQTILNNIFFLLKPGGYAVISVMNLHRTEAKAKYKFSIEKSTIKLHELQASNTMNETGDVFDPEYYMIDTDTKIIYRKELFSYDQTSSKNKPPIELIVRDRRFYMDEIVEMCNKAGLEVIQKRFVNAGWQRDETCEEAREILLICKKKG
ncbi:bifunctional 3-demethylubiquinone-9 3-methyltransferase/ 2-octaprenyl-6-hydroxy phenol methylase [Bacteroidales bacterium Barb6]|nr:bifunctional 3-demethylubiquinone-9 3-methyltransferase/ 2-octaprenyl-6-hydroxy phenol methylase [Bacteroidales bacterium Barb6]